MEWKALLCISWEMLHFARSDGKIECNSAQDNLLRMVAHLLVRFA